MDISTILNYKFGKYNCISAKGWVITIIDFSPLWKTMEKKNVSQYKLLKSGIDNKTLDSLKKNNNITLLTLEKLCEVLDCTPNDVLRFVKDKEENQ